MAHAQASGQTGTPSSSPPSLPAPDLARLLGAVVESSDDAILAKDLNGTILSWNSAAARIYGYAAEEAVGRNVSMLVPPEIRDDIPRILERLARGEPIGHYETVRMRRDGERINMSLTISPVRDDSGRIIGASTIARDISQRKREESRWRLLSKLSDALAPVLDEEELLRELARLAVTEFADYSVTYLYRDGVIRRVGAAHADPGQVELVQRLVEMAPPAITDALGAGAVIRTGEAAYARDIPVALLEQAAGGGPYLEALMALGPVSSMVLPLRARGRTVGAVALATTTRSMRRYTADDLAFGGELARRAGLLLDNVRLYASARAGWDRSEAAEAALRGQYEQLRVLYEMTSALARTGDLEEIYRQALDGLSAGIGVPRASILLFDPDGVMRFKAWRGLSDGYRRAVEGHSPWAADAVDPSPIAVADVAESGDLDAALQQTILDEGIRSMAFIPLTFHGRLLGKFMLYGDEPSAFLPDEMELSRTIAASVSFAIVRARDEHAIRAAMAEAERANDAKSQFLGVMSHELRTPLNALLGYSELLLLETKGPINEGQREQVERMQASARHQLGLVEELLTYTRLEAGREEPRLMATDLRRVVTDVAELVRPEADKKGLALNVRIPPDLPLVLSDPAKLRQIALNLVGNATKFTEAGSVEMRLRLAGGRLVLTVSDTGPGIPANKLDYIFEPFARVDETRTRRTEGTGLGLAIARRLAALLDGHVVAESREGAGSTFRLSVAAPVVTPTPDAPATPDPTA